MGTTSRGYRYPDATDAVNVNGHIQNLASDLNTDVGAQATSIATAVSTASALAAVIAVYNSAAVGLTSGSTSVLGFDSLDQDSKGKFVTPKFFAAAAGLYVIHANLQATVAAAGVGTLQVRANGSTLLNADNQAGRGSSSQTWRVTSWFTLVANTGYLEVLFTPTGGGSPVTGSGRAGYDALFYRVL